MKCKLLLLLLHLLAIAFGDEKKGLQEKNRLIGLDTVHNVNIDKDTIITRNLKIGKKEKPIGNKWKTCPKDIIIVELEIITCSIRVLIRYRRHWWHVILVVDKTKMDDVTEPNWSYNSFSQEVSPHVEQFKRNMTECLKEVQAKDKKTVKRLSPKTESPVHGECLIACVLKRNGVISNGKVHKDNLLQLVSKFFARDTRLMKKLEKNLDRCIEASSKSRDECTMASRLNACTNDLMYTNKQKIFINY